MWSPVNARPATPKIIIIEIISYLSRPVSLSVRLFANMMAGHTMLKVFGGFVISLGILGGWLPLSFSVALTGLEILLSQQMVDFSREVIVEFNGTEVARKQPLANLGCLLQFYAASDAQRTYSDTVKLR